MSTSQRMSCGFSLRAIASTSVEAIVARIESLLPG